MVYCFRDGNGFVQNGDGELMVYVRYVLCFLF